MAFRDIRRQRKWLSAEELRLLLGGLVVLVLALTANIALARVLPGGEWLFQRWIGARALLAEVLDVSGGARGGRIMPEGGSVLLAGGGGPYTTEIARRTQEIVYGRRAFSSEYTYVLTDPFFILLLYTPLAFFSDYTVARGIWMLAAEAALIATLLLAFSLSEWRPRRGLYALLIAFVLLHYFSLSALVTATPAIFLGFLYAAILLALRSGADELGGVLLALAAYQWEVGGLFFLFIIVFAIINRRWGVLAGLGMALFVLLALSFLVDSDWGLPYLRAVLSGWYRGQPLTLGSILMTHLPQLQFPAGRFAAAALGFVLLIEWWAAAGAHFRQVVWTACLSVAATPLMGLPVFPSNHVVLLLPFVLILALVWERWPRYRRLRVSLLLLAVLLIPFGMYARVVSVYDPLMVDLISVLPPLAAIVGLYWMRWWLLRAPRSLLGNFGDRA